MDSALRKLMELGGEALCSSAPIVPPTQLKVEVCDDHLFKELNELLSEKNGFYGFEGALHVFPSMSDSVTQSLESWNDGGLWRGYYGSMTDECFFFAEDVFGFQYAIKGGTVCKFDSETGVASHVADTIGAWAGVILNDLEFETGYPFAHQWQSINGPLKNNERLFQRYPFVLGGKYELSNLFACDSVYGMQFRGAVAQQIKDIPDGTQVQIVFDPPQ